MGVEPQENRGIPRNRKCGNCRFYEAAPLWRKGWCRNPKLYPPHANHLVDANTIDCEGGFRSRIYWEPLAGGQAVQPSPPDVRPVAASNVNPISPVAADVTPISAAPSANAEPVAPRPPVNPLIGRPISQPISQPVAPSNDPYQRPLEQPTVSVYKHPLADRSFAKSSDEAIRPVNTTPSPIISRQTYSNPGPDNSAGAGNSRAPFTPSNSNNSNNGEGQDNNYPPYNPRSNRSYSNQEPGNRSFSSQEPPTRSFSAQEPNNRGFSQQEPNNRGFSSQEPNNRGFSPQEPPNRNYSQESAGRNFSSQEPPARPFVTPPPAAPVYDDQEDFSDTRSFNDPAPGYQDQPTRPFQEQATRPYQNQPPQYAPPQDQPDTWQEQEPAPRPRKYSDPANFASQADNFPPPAANNNYSSQSNNNYSTQPGNYSSQFGSEKEPIRIQEALPVNSRPRPLEPRKQPQPAPARFRPINEDQPAANMPVSRDWKAILREKAPFTRNWNLEGITMNRQTILPWAIGGILVLILVVVLIANIGKKTDQNNPTVPAGTTSGAITSSGSGTTSSNQTTTAGKTTVAATTSAATATTAPPVKTAVVKGTGAVLNVRDQPTTKGTLVTTIKDGEKVTIKDGPKDGDGRSWYQIEYGGKTGWAAAEFLELQS